MSSDRPDPPALLIVRPEPEASEMTRMLKERVSWEVVPCPVTTVVTIAQAQEPTNADAVLLTSPRAVGAALPFGLPVIAVGEATTERARKSGLEVVGTGPGRMGGELAQLARGHRRVLHLSGEHLAGDPADTFAAAGLAYERRIVYRAEALRRLPDEAARLLGERAILGAVLMSVRNTRLFAVLARPFARTGTRVEALCFSEKIADAASRSGLFDKVSWSGEDGGPGFVDFIAARCT